MGATDFNWAMSYAAKGGHVEIVKLCKEWGATDFDEAMEEAAREGHVEIVKLYKEWGQQILTGLCHMQLRAVTSRS